VSASRAGTVKTRARRDPEQHGRLAGAEPVQHGRLQDRLELRGEPVQRPDDVALLEGGQGLLLGAGGIRDPSAAEQARQPPLGGVAALDVQQAPDGDPPDPGAHLTPTTEAAGVAPHHQERLLGDLVGQARVGGALAQPHQQPGGVQVVQGPERLRVPLGHRRQQLGVGRDLIGARAHA
jgi:hypothetical protein